MKSLNVLFFALVVIATLGGCSKTPAPSAGDPFLANITQCNTDIAQPPTNANPTQAQGFCNCFYTAVKNKWTYDVYSANSAVYDQQLAAQGVVATCLNDAGL